MPTSVLFATFILLLVHVILWVPVPFLVLEVSTSLEHFHFVINEASYGPALFIVCVFLFMNRTFYIIRMEAELTGAHSLSPK